MSHFTYSFCVSLFHSLWQSALLLILYATIQHSLKKQHPSFQRNLLFGFLFSQVLISIITFYAYYNQSFFFYLDMIEGGLYNLVLKQTLIEKFSPIIVGLYALVFFAKTVHLIYTWLEFKHTYKCSLTKPSIDLRLFTFTKANEFGISRKVSIWLSSAVSTPVTFGYLKPVILMPVALLNHLSIADTETLIIHELTHIKSNDYLLNWLLVITKTLFFYNPFIRILANKIKLEREKNCDVQVLQFKYSAISYAETLLKTAKFQTTINLFTIAAVFKHKQLLQRILFFTQHHNLQFSKKQNGGILAPFIITALLLNLLMLVQIKNKQSGTRYREITVLSQPGKKYIENIVPVAFTNISPDAVLKTATPETIKVAAEPVIINQQTKEMSEVNRVTRQNTSGITFRSVNENYVIQAAARQTEENEVIVKEETSGTGQIITKAYKVQLKNGQWKNELLYIVKEGKPFRDSSICYLKDSAIRFVPAMQ
ncbi:MAG: M56 family metallopeptidase [Ferruginibacter sp.]|nr:M56 family metallopeptidase [Ferruginibacter sp.]